MNLSWARNFTGRLKIIYYDDLVADVESALREILSFLNFPIDEVILSLFALVVEVSFLILYMLLGTLVVRTSTQGRNL